MIDNQLKNPVWIMFSWVIEILAVHIYLDCIQFMIVLNEITQSLQSADALFLL